ncbi:Zn-dependent hydrolase [Anaeromyxobacter oryzae]|uniref:Zn-dependent hydrolase n=1 Tax=Anaeromyxobacter oryzae TaxID=2918170 RepID=A0ABN6MN55_9BACT|nr:Zn-dependent hydrolase [Anaeromyxobacter oryzae]BDG02477.1 Zn-dependent hydrolase [Anaeromyxobacter oryzae]
MHSAGELNGLRVNGERLWASLMDLAKIGATPKGGVCRLAVSEADGKGRDLVVSWARAAGLTVTVDRIGNIFMRRPGRAMGKPPVMMGSHVDTQPTGGKFDGNYGVLAGLEVIRTLNDRRIETEAPLEVVAWTNEEGSRFVPVMMGSGVFCNVFPLEVALSAKDLQGKTVGDELRNIGYAGQLEPGGRAVAAYFEAHIEQGPVLEDAGKVIGVVEAVLGLRWYDCIVTGLESHAGATPMGRRKDALQVAATIMREVVAIAERYPPHGRGTVGFAQVHPNSRNVIPGQVTFSIDLRNVNRELHDRMDADLRAFAAMQQERTGVKVELREVSYNAPVHFHPDCVSAVRRATERLGYSHMPATSGPGHDAVFMARVAPTGMIFIPCKDGISHNEIEHAEPEHVTAGANVLLQAVLEKSGVAA